MAAGESDLEVPIHTALLYDNKNSLGTQLTSATFGDCMIVWFVSKKESDFGNYRQTLTHLRTIADYFEAFIDIDKCIDFISSLVDEKVFLIIPLNEADQLIPLIHNLPQIAYIYVCDEMGKENVNDNLLNRMNDFSVVRSRIHKLNKHFFDQLQHDVKIVQTRLLPFTVYPLTVSTNNSTLDLNKEQVSYRWNQLLLDALRKLPQNIKSKQDILNECKAQYCNNEQELEKIEQFEKTYQPDLAVWWYTRDCFLYKLFNKALRTEDIDVVFKFRFFITNLYDQLTDLHNQSKSKNSNILTVYRGQQLAPNELEVFKLNINGIISMNTFLSTTTNKNVALIYAGDGSERPLLESILFEMKIDVNQSDKPLADISKISYMLDEDEVLLSIGMIFTIKSVEKIDNNVWKVKLTSINDTDIQLSDYYNCLKQEIEQDDEPLGRFGSLLFQMGLYEKEEKYYLMLLEEGSYDYAMIYNNLGLCYYAKHDFKRALDYYKISVNYYKMTGCDKHPCCTQTYNNIGLIYQHEEDYNQALKFHKKALEIHIQYPTLNIRGFILTLKQVGCIHAARGAYDKALEMYLHALTICDTSLPKNHPDTAVMYSMIGKVYLALGHYDKSMEIYKTSLRLKEETLPNDHLYIATALNDIGLVYDSKGEYGHALDYYKQAQAIYTKRGKIGCTELATVYGNMGVIYSKIGEYSLALDCQQKCLEIRKQFFSQDSKSVAIVYSNMAVVYGKMKDTAKAIEHLQKAINIICNSQVPNDPHLGFLYNNIGMDYAAQGNLEQASYYYNMSLDIKHRYFPQNHPSIALTLCNISDMLSAKGDIKTAIFYREKALKIYEKSLSDNHPQRVACVEDIAILKTCPNLYLITHTKLINIIILKPFFV